MSMQREVHIWRIFWTGKIWENWIFRKPRLLVLVTSIDIWMWFQEESWRKKKIRNTNTYNCEKLLLSFFCYNIIVMIMWWMDVCLHLKFIHLSHHILSKTMLTAVLMRTNHGFFLFPSFFVGLCCVHIELQKFSEGSGSRDEIERQKAKVHPLPAFIQSFKKTMPLSNMWVISGDNTVNLLIFSAHQFIWLSSFANPLVDSLLKSPIH